MDARTAERIAHDLYGERQTVHRGGGERRRLFGRVHRLHSARDRLKQAQTTMWKPSILLALIAVTVPAQDPSHAGNPYRTVHDYFQLPAGRTWGSSSAVFAAANGHIWIAERCGANSCAGKTDP